MAVSGSSGPGLTISASSVTLDLNGQEILCPGGLKGVGVSGAQNVVIRNGHLSNCAMGVVIVDSAKVRLEGLTIRGTAFL